MVLDTDDEQIIKDARTGGAIVVTWDRVVRQAAGGLSPYEAMDKALADGKGTAEAKADLSRLRQLTPANLTALRVAGNKTVELFRQIIEVNELGAKLIRRMRVDEDYSWRAIARHISRTLKATWGANQLAGMVLCEKAAKLLGEDYLQPPWN